MAKATKKKAKPAKKKPVKKVVVKAKAKAAPKKKPAVKKPAKKKPARQVVSEEVSTPSMRELSGRAMIVQILADAEAYFFDFAKLSAGRRTEMIEHHLAAYDRRKQAEGKPDWIQALVPIALLGESMPPPPRK